MEHVMTLSLSLVSVFDIHTIFESLGVFLADRAPLLSSLSLVSVSSTCMISRCFRKEGVTMTSSSSLVSTFDATLFCLAKVGVMFGVFLTRSWVTIRCPLLVDGVEGTVPYPPWLALSSWSLRLRFKGLGAPGEREHIK